MPTTAATTKKLRHRTVTVSTPRRRRRRCADRSVGSDCADTRNQCRSLDRSVVRRRFLRRCPARLGYVDDRVPFRGDRWTPLALWYRSYSLISLTDLRREIRTRRSLTNAILTSAVKKRNCHGTFLYSFRSHYILYYLHIVFRRDFEYFKHIYILKTCILMHLNACFQYIIIVFTLISLKLFIYICFVLTIFQRKKKLSNLKR